MNFPIKRVVATLSLGLAAVPASASDLLGFYVGAGATRSEIKAELPASQVTGAALSDNDTGWKGLVGIRALSLFGAELEYVDLGSASFSSSNGVRLDADLKSTALFGLFWLPIPAPFVDVYAKAGYARLSGSFSGRGAGGVCPAVSPTTLQCAPPFSRSLDDDVVAAGAGAQVKLGSWAVRGDYERFFASGSDPSVVSLSLVKFFL